MKKIFLLMAVFIIAGTNAFSQEKGITRAMLKEIKTGIKKDKNFEARVNAITGNSIKDLALGRENKGKNDHYFSHEVKTKGITDQESSGRCWLFTGLNVLKPKVMETFNLPDFEFSHNYNFFWDQMEKSNLFLQAIIDTREKPLEDRKVEWLLKNAIGDGGQWTGVVNIVNKYGVVPLSAMPETKSSSSTRMMRRLLSWKLKEFALELREMHKEEKKIDDLQERKTGMLTDIYKMLVMNLGQPPVEFNWRYKDKDGNLSEEKTYTPKAFYKEAIGVNLQDYVMFMNDPSREFGKLYEIEYDRHMYDGDNWKYINLEIEKIKEFAKKSIMGNDAMYFSCDVGKQLNSDAGFLDINNYNYEALFDVEYKMDKKERILTFSSGSTHGMTLMAVDVDKKGKTKKWKLENSWGAKSGHNGYLTMTDQWFDEYMFRVVIHKKYVPGDVLEILEQEPVILPPWDPMYMPDN